MIAAIVAADPNWAIGYAGQLCIFCKEDLTFFKEQTLGCVVVCGSATLKTFPDGLPLLGRETWILSRKLPEFISDKSRPSRIFRDLNLLRTSIVAEQRPVWIAGGESMYNQLLYLCECCVVSRFRQPFSPVDTYFPKLSELLPWYLAEESDLKHCCDYSFTHQFWRKK